MVSSSIGVKCLVYMKKFVENKHSYLLSLVLLYARSIHIHVATPRLSTSVFGSLPTVNINAKRIKRQLQDIYSNTTYIFSLIKKSITPTVLTSLHVCTAAPRRPACHTDFCLSRRVVGIHNSYYAVQDKMKLMQSNS